MKKLFLLLVGVTIFSCSKDKEPCSKVQGKQIKYEPCGGGLNCAVFYFTMDGEKSQIVVSEQDYHKFELGEIYCKK